MKILIAVIDSARSEQAVRFVVGLRWPAGSRVILATESGPSSSAAASSAQTRLRAVGVSTELRTLEGEPRAGLQQLIENEHVDLLIMGSGGSSGHVQLMRGGDLSYAATHTKCSVMVVKQPATAHMRQRQPLDPPMKILIGVDESPHSRAAVNLVRRMEWPQGTTFVVVSVAQPAFPAYAEFHVTPTSAVDLQGDLVQMHEEIVKNARSSLQGTAFSTTTKVLHGDPSTELIEAARSEQADLMVVGSHGRTGLAKLLFGSVAQHIVTYAPCNVLVVKLYE